MNNKIKIDYRSRETAKEFFPNTDEKIKIPTLISYVDGKYNIFWNEFPAVVKNEMDKNPENFEDIKYNFRIGKFNAQIEKELVDYLTSL